tara:strand:- start:700 stop:1050 length:351 start_codon:yes stop_codon:yes gene_type:complete
MLEDPTQYDPRKFVELQDLNIRDQMEAWMNEADFTDDPDFMSNLATEMVERPPTKYDRLKQIEIESLQSVVGERELNDQEKLQIEKNVKRQMLASNPKLNQMSSYVQEKLRTFLGL